MPPITACDEPWSFFLFWHHRFLTKIICTQLLQEEEIFPMIPRSEWSAQWSLRYAQKCSKSWVKNLEQKISCHYSWMLHAKNYLSQWRFLRSFLTASKPSRRSITAGKARGKEKKKGQKKNSKIKKPRDVGHFLAQKLSQNFDFCACPGHNALKHDVVARKASCCVANAFSTGSKIIVLRSSLKINKMSKKHTLCKKFQESMG